MTGPIRLSEEVADALADRRPVVALETSVLAQGLPVPRNREAAGAMAGVIRASGAVPAWIAVDAGQVRVGLTENELARLAVQGRAAKVARRDLPIVVASGGLGATTVSAALWAAHRAGIEVLATGGIGGVHQGSGDVSADLLELASTPALVVCSGPKSIVDPVATMERLEELGVSVVGYRCDRLPFFVAGYADVPLEHRVDTPAEAAAVALALRRLDVRSSVVLCNPVREGLALDRDVVADAVRACEERAVRQGVRGKDVTPFLLSCLAERTGGESLQANLALLESNAGLAAEVAAALASGARS
jgi:pseudouridine-5'-phosphate glycosidase